VCFLRCKLRRLSFYAWRWPGVIARVVTPELSALMSIACAIIVGGMGSILGGILGGVHDHGARAVVVLTCCPTTELTVFLSPVRTIILVC
jgi:branched-chain amino acid transport system permease protein